MKNFKLNGAASLWLVAVIITITAMAFTACTKKAENSSQNVSGKYSTILNGDLSIWEGTWINGHDERVQLKPDGTINNMEISRNFLFLSSTGNYMWENVVPGEFAYDVYFIPKGIEFVNYYGNIQTDITKDRIYFIISAAERITTSDDVYYSEKDLEDEKRANFAIMWAQQDAAGEYDPNVFNYDKILNGDLSEFSAYWINGRSERLWLNSNGTISSNRTQTASGFCKHGDAYNWNVSEGEFGGFGVLLYPVDVDVLLGRSILKTDNTKVRLTYGHDLPDDPKDYFYLESDTGASSGNAIIQIGFSRDKHFTFRKVHEFEDKDNLGNGIVITSDITIKDFSFIAVDYDYEADSWIVERTLFTIPELKSSEHSEAFQANTNVGDGKPSRGITFIDGNTRRYFYISESGVDGSLSLTEFQLRK